MDKNRPTPASRAVPATVSLPRTLARCIASGPPRGSIIAAQCTTQSLPDIASTQTLRVGSVAHVATNTQGVELLPVARRPHQSVYLVPLLPPKPTQSTPNVTSGTCYEQPHFHCLFRSRVLLDRSNFGGRESKRLLSTLLRMNGCSWELGPFQSLRGSAFLFSSLSSPRAGSLPGTGLFRTGVFASPQSVSRSCLSTNCRMPPFWK